jgi:uncharacterized Zn finger protein
MEKYGEFLFDAESTDLKECLNNISEENIESCCEYKIFNRGYDYYHDGMVEEIWYNKKANTISAEVIGTKEYNVELYIENGEVHGSCNCEYYDVCKHIIAVLLDIAENGIENIPESKIIEVPSFETVDYFKDHLKKLTKDELINLVLRYAPDDYIRQIQNSKSTQKDASAIFDRVEKKVRENLSDEELLWDPSGMDAAIMKQLNKLKGLENQLHERISQLLLMIMESIDAAFDEGYLYIDNYYEEDYFESSEFNNYVISYVQKLPFENKFRFIQELNTTIGGMGYSTFEGIPKNFSNCFSIEETAKLADYVLSSEQNIDLSLIANIYGFINSSLEEKDNEKLLKALSLTGSQEHLILLTELLVSQARLKEALDSLSQFLVNQQGFIDNKIVELFLQLTKESGTDIVKAAWTALNHNPNEKNLSLIKSYGVSDTSAFEELLRNNNPVELLSFYEKEKRFSDALKLISDKNRFYDEIIFQFFKRNKKALKEQAEQYFLKRIDANLVSTGDNFYSKIAETVSQIKQINAKLAGEVVTDLRTNYKRRTKLMSMLNRF